MKIIYWVIVILGALSAIFYKKIVGLLGEFYVKNELKKLPKNEYKILNDVMLKDINGYTHQIDHIVVSQYGIFVIETKQYNGFIIGNEYEKTWLLNKSIKIRNPIHQNYGHIKTIESLLNIESNKLISIVCFSSRATLRVKTKTPVIEIYKLNDTIRKYEKIIINDYEEIYNKINELNIKDNKVRREHIKNIKNRGKNG